MNEPLYELKKICSPARVYRFPEAYANFCKGVELLQTTFIRDWSEEGFGLYQTIYRFDKDDEWGVSYGIYLKDTIDNGPGNGKGR
jgi:hypothetical protein